MTGKKQGKANRDEGLGAANDIIACSRRMKELEAGEFAVEKGEHGEQCRDQNIAIKCPHCGKEMIMDIWQKPSQTSRIVTFRSRKDYEEHRRLTPIM